MCFNEVTAGNGKTSLYRKIQYMEVRYRQVLQYIRIRTIDGSGHMRVLMVCCSILSLGVRCWGDMTFQRHKVPITCKSFYWISA